MNQPKDLPSLEGRSVLRTADSLKESNVGQENDKKRSLLYYPRCFQNSEAKSRVYSKSSVVRMIVK